MYIYICMRNRFIVLSVGMYIDMHICIVLTHMHMHTRMLHQVWYQSLGNLPPSALNPNSNVPQHDIGNDLLGP